MKTSCLKSHDCHTLMQQLLPVAIRSVLEKPARWMYPFERYMKVLKGYVQNRTRPEGCIAERYIAEEALECFKPKDGVSKPLSGCTVSATYDPHQDCLSKNLEREQSGCRISTIALSFNGYASRYNVQSELEEDNHGVSENLRWLAAGPNMAAQDDVRTTQNSGVYLLAHTMQVASAKDKNPILSNMGFYGVIQEIWDLDYQKFTIPVFRCDWIDSSGLVVDELGFTLVDLSKIGHRNDQFVWLLKSNKYFLLTTRCIVVLATKQSVQKILVQITTLYSA
ncbi:hypothetical protein Prudu_018761 [Prunus dulcis]|uniref:DUF4218 domain-containing protein n=1 Tax=Prunus dulcis TaxID=3755 RepID=A0A4Y1RSQ7_PRUDU|nr:hypothetical protein Prudu_018761 [Prunus dulcis]